MPEGVHADRVTDWFRENVPEATPPLDFELIAGGHSNLTYRVTDSSGATFVLRRPPLGGILESAHDVAREHRIISALQATDVPVPAVFGVCTDAAVNDSAFFVMGFVDGRIMHARTDAEGLPEQERRPVGFAVIDVLARLHAVDPEAVGLGELGRREGYIARQLRRWSRQWVSSKTREIPEMEETHRELEKRMPEQVGACIAHGDYRLGNLIVRDRRVAAVLDWELCTLGDGLADVGWILNSWTSADETLDGSSNPTAVGGFPSREELIERYERSSGRDLARINYYRAFSYWRHAAIVEGVYRRYVEGSMGSAEGVDITRFEQLPPRMAQTALELVRDS